MSKTQINMSTRGNLALARAVAYLVFPGEPGGKPPLTSSSCIHLLRDLALRVDVKKGYSCEITQFKLAQYCILTERTVSERLKELRNLKIITQKHRLGHCDKITLDAELIFQHRDDARALLKLSATPENANAYSDDAGEEG